ncbi:MAG: hypothetical protein COV48_01525 [Elusimicrobia bacterium CG11_big_fil_rev_8_21_14_0_20_64_6]|nr:MAG: hypothetical protein COV48_01525 [Elusimicrobia bacterium CG11_big_fil_rev_8_21_14_0_20_64_6]
MTIWLDWTAEAFARAKAQGRPILATVGPFPSEHLKAAEEEIGLRFVAVLADPQTRPDAAARIGPKHALILDPEGARRAVLPLPYPALGESLARLAFEAVSPLRPDGPAASAWTGAVREADTVAAPDEAKIFGVLAALGTLPAGPEPDPDFVSALLHGAGERGDAEAFKALTRALELRMAGWDATRRSFLPAPGSSLSLHARWAAVFWDAHALTGEARWRTAAEGITDHLLRALWDVSAGAFRRAGKPEPVVYPADGNALAASALFRAHAFGHPGAGDAALKALSFLQNRLYDPLLGFQHAAGGEGESVFGLLGDAVAVALAFTDGFLATGIKAHREFSDATMRFLFQELWERDGGGFLDRVCRADDPAVLREPHLDPALNAAALEICRRLHHLKGNHNYRRWLEWGLKGAWNAAPDDARVRAGLARVADLHARGRMDFELVGRPGESKTDALLAAVNRLYLPRKVISFVDPDDQDYILAHHLGAESYPRVFGCGADLRRLADAGDPEGVLAVAEAVAHAVKPGGAP